MKYLITLSFLLNQMAFASQVELEEFDQLKLAELLVKISPSLKVVKTTPLITPQAGTLVETRFPKASDVPFSIKCQSSYFNHSPFASFAKCSLTVDVNHQETQKSYDELKITLKDKDTASSFFENIPHGKPRRDFRSHGKEWGTTSEGKGGFIFHYFFSCSTLECSLKLSNKVLR